MLAQRNEKLNGRACSAGRGFLAKFSSCVIFCAMATASFAGMAACSLPKYGDSANIDQLYAPMVECLAQGRVLEAGKLYYAVELRMRALGKADESPRGTRASIKKLQKEYGPKINGYLGGDIREWLSALDWAKEFDAASPWPEMADLFAKAGDSEASLASRGQARSELSSLRAHVASLDRKAFYAKRKESGLAIRDAEYADGAPSKP
jgi:hypothetical protein